MSAQTFWLENLKQANRLNQWVFSQILPHLGQTILEVGCGNGNFTELFAQTNAQVTAIDHNAEYTQAAKLRLQAYPQVRVQTLDAIHLKGKAQFDTIVLLDVLEHIDEDVMLLSQLSQLLQPNGKLIVKVPALPWLYSPMDQAIGHYRRYTRSSLKQTFQQAGLEPLIWYFNIPGILGWWWYGKVLRRVTPPAEQVSLFNRLVPLFQAIESQFSPPLGLCLFAIAQPRSGLTGDRKV